MIPKPEIISWHINRYFPSLEANKKNYLHLFFQESQIIPLHYAYVCPICVNTGLAFLKEYFLDTNSEFTLDHFPPKSVGGKQSLLVCKKCNNEAGASFENELKQKIEDISFDDLIGTATRNMKTTISTIKGNYPGILSIKDDGTFGIDFKVSKKIHSPLLDQWIENSKNDLNWTAEVTYHVADEIKVSKSLLKAAYLHCFQYWGYDFSYSNTAKNIRKVLKNQINYPLKNPSFWLGKVASTVEKLPLGLCYLSVENEFKCFCINMQIIDKKTKHGEIACVLISGPSQACWDDLEKIQKLLDRKADLKVSFSHVMENSVSDNIYDGYEKSWINLSNS